MSPEEIENLKKQIAAGKKKLNDILELRPHVPGNVFTELIAIYEQRAEITSGTYFGCTADFWKIGGHPSGVNYEQKWKAFHREQGIEDLPSSYMGTIEKIVGVNAGNYDAVTPTPSSARSKGSNTASINTNTCDIFGSPPGVFSEEKAHLLPSSLRKRPEWIGVAGAVLGLNPEEEAFASFYEKLLKATHGVKKKKDKSDVKPPAKKKQNPNDASINADNRSSATPREACTGVVHFPENLIRLRFQGTRYDGDRPQVLIVPSLTLEEARNWRGGEYEAVVLVGFPSGFLAREGYPMDLSEDIHEHIGSTRNNLVSKILAMKNRSHEEPAILEKARQSLKETLLAVVGYAQYMVKKGSDIIKTETMETFRRIANNFEEKLLLPEKRDDYNRMPLLYVTFGAQGGAESLGQDGNLSHPAPDPLLLLVKAAAIWGLMTEFKLIANGEEEDDDDGSGCDEDCPSHRADIPREIYFSPQKTMNTETMDYGIQIR